MKVTKEYLKKLIRESLEEADAGEPPEPGKSFADVQMKEPESAGGGQKPMETNKLIEKATLEVRNAILGLQGIKKELELYLSKGPSGAPPLGTVPSPDVPAVEKLEEKNKKKK